MHHSFVWWFVGQLQREKNFSEGLIVLILCSYDSDAAGSSVHHGHDRSMLWACQLPSARGAIVPRKDVDQDHPKKTFRVVSIWTNSTRVKKDVIKWIRSRNKLVFNALNLSSFARVILQPSANNAFEYPSDKKLACFISWPVLFFSSRNERWWMRISQWQLTMLVMCRSA